MDFVDIRREKRKEREREGGEGGSRTNHRYIPLSEYLICILRFNDEMISTALICTFTVDQQESQGS